MTSKKRSRKQRKNEREATRRRAELGVEDERAPASDDPPRRPRARPADATPPRRERDEDDDAPASVRPPSRRRKGVQRRNRTVLLFVALALAGTAMVWLATRERTPEPKTRTQPTAAAKTPRPPPAYRPPRAPILPPDDVEPPDVRHEPPPPPIAAPSAPKLSTPKVVAPISPKAPAAPTAPAAPAPPPAPAPAPAKSEPYE